MLTRKGPRRPLFIFSLCAVAVLFAVLQVRAQSDDPSAVVARYYALLGARDYKGAAALVAGSDSKWAIARFENAIESDPQPSTQPRRDLPGREGGTLRPCTGNLKNIGTALEMYSTDNSGRYPTRLSQIVPNYLKTLPTCPAAGSDTYSERFTSASDPDAYTVICSGHHHADEAQGENYPQYTSFHGLLVMQSEAPPTAPPRPFTIASARVVAHRGSGDSVEVRVEETYVTHTVSTRVFTSFPVRRINGAWKIDGAELARRTDALEAFTAGLPAGLPPVLGPYLRTPASAFVHVNGLGSTFAALIGVPAVPGAAAMLAQVAFDGCVSNLKNIGVACEMYSTDNSGRYPPTLALVTPNYLKTLPTCPGAGTDTYTDGFVSRMKPVDIYTAVCSGANHTLLGVPANFPQYNSTEGLVRRP